MRPTRQDRYDLDRELTEDEIKEIVDIKNVKIIEVIMKRMHLSRSEAFKLWYNSQTKRLTLDSKINWGITIPRLYDELERELNHDELWMVLPIE